MKKVFLALALVILGTCTIFTVVSAQNVKTITWSEFWRGVEFVQQTNGQWEFTHGSRPLGVYTLVEVSADTVVERHLYHIGTLEGYRVYLVVLDPTVAIMVGGRVANIRAMFVCDQKLDDSGCRQAFSSLLSRNITLQSLGVSNSGYEGGAFPENPIFSFLVNTSGKFIR